MLVPLQLQFEIQLNDDDDLIHRDHAAAAGRVVINRFYSWLPKLIPKRFHVQSVCELIPI